MREKGYSVQIKAVQARYGSKDSAPPVLHDLNFEVRQGEFVSVVGKSGTGKSTLLRLLAGLMVPSEGSVRVFGEHLKGPPPHLGYVVQDYGASLFPWLRVSTNVALAMGNLDLSLAAKREKTEELLRKVGLEGSGQRYPWQLSGGMQQRVAIARALAAQPKLLLLDEPFASIDAQTRLELETLTRVLAREGGFATVLVTHDIDEAIYMADRVAVLAGTPATLTKEFIVGLPEVRRHLETRNLPTFHKLRAEVFRELGLTESL